MLGTPRALLAKATKIAVAAVLATGGVAAVPAQADAVGLPPNTAPALPAAAAEPTDQFIVRVKEKAGPASAAAGRAAAEAAKKLGVPARDVRATATGARILKTDRALPAAEAATFLATLRADPDVEYAEPDTIMHAAAEPDNGGYPLQWGLWEEAGGIRAPGAWQVNRGQGVVVAVVDTGITSHMDLDANVLPGYDMISNAANARDGGGRDANPRDEGDWASADECGTGTVVGPSSWHGTHVAGTIAAVADNGNNVMTGVAPKAKILPLRALGPCGGYSSDVTDSIIWAAGGTVPGAPVNTNRARVINLSLGGVVARSNTYQQAINFANSAGAAVVVAGGNSNRPAADLSPANCQNVIAVAASTRKGARAPYSNYGSAIDVAAPGGDMGPDMGDGILSTYNDGMTTPEGGGYAYLQGTSMAAPHVSGVTALLMARMGPSYTPAAAEQRLKDTARPLPAGCIGGCGAGLIDATAALDFVVEPDPDDAVPGVFKSTDPFRALDTRSGSPVAGDASVSFQVAGVNGVPANASAVVFNLTVADAKSFGFVTAYPSGTARPNASNVNFSAGQIVANTVTVPLGADGRVSLFNRSFGAAHLLADVSGYFVPTVPSTAGAFMPTAPERFLDTRAGDAVGPDSSVSFRVAGQKGIPSNVSAVVFNLTVAEAQSFGFVTAYPSGTDRPNASSVNFTRGQIVPNSVTVPVGADGKITLFNRSSAPTHLLADVSGYYLPGTPSVPGTFQPVAPNRFLDTRNTPGVGADSSVSFQAAGAKGIPAAVSAVVFNMTVADAQSFGFATAYASGTGRPNASNVNFNAGQIVPNSVTVPVGADGKVALFNRSGGATHFLSDVAGYYLR